MKKVNVKKALIITAAVAGAVAGLAALKRRGPGAESSISETANVWAQAVSEAAEKAADKLGDVAQGAAEKADLAAQKLSDAAAETIKSDKPVLKVSEAAATVGAAVADAADATEKTATDVAKATGKTVGDAARTAGRAAQATAEELADKE